MLFRNGFLILVGVASCQLSYAAEPDWAKMCDDPTINHIDRSKVAENTIEAIGYDACQSSKQIVCIDLTQSVLDIYEKLDAKWTNEKDLDAPFLFLEDGTGARYNTNIYSNFDRLLTLHDTAFTKIDAEMAAALDDINNIDSLDVYRQKILDISAYMKQGRADLLALDQYDEKFLVMINHEQKLIYTLAPQFASLGNSPSCAFLQDDLSKIKAHASSWQGEFDRLRNYVVNAQEKRRYLIDVIEDGLRAHVLEKYKATIGKEYEKSKDIIAGALYLSSISIEIDNWWFEANKNGLAARLHTRHLQYSMPLRILTGHQAQANAYKQKLAKLKGSYSPEIIKMIDQGLDTKIALINSNLDYINRLGWQGFYQQEVSLANKRLQSIDKYVPQCAALISDYLDKSKDISDLKHFQEIEPVYLKLSVGCTPKR